MPTTTTHTITVEYSGLIARADYVARIVEGEFRIDLRANGLGEGTLVGDTEDAIHEVFANWVDLYAADQAIAAMEQWPDLEADVFGTNPEWDFVERDFTF